ncbi:MAG TPA: D-2-hydroxyacid dehydrogenase [Pyrinomonadaceae bacterium]|nr:D-2-hydroxyacid dehydrogenase [Pyrinomonadaceae bacterium]
MEQIVFLERSTFAVAFRRPRFEHAWVDYEVTQPTEIVERLRHATIAICNKLPLRADVLSQLPSLRLIAVAATGVDNIDLEFCKSHSIAVCNGRNYATTSLPEHVLTLIFALRRNLIAYRDDLVRGDWQRAKQFCLLSHPINDLSGSTIGIVGYGALGKATANLAQAVGMSVLVAERKDVAIIRDGRASFVDVLRRSDVLSLHCPLTDATRNLIGATELELMKPTSILVNTARGALVDEAALVEALKEGTIGGAAIDVLRVEPPIESNVLLEETVPNLIVTPHVGWASHEAMQALADQVIDNLEAFVRGQPRNLVT